jgi:pimeloyl-ACP methyl ester carboxylesterase
MPQFEHDGITLNYEDVGDREAPAVVLLHGFTSDLRSWAPLLDDLTADYRAIAFDLRGHGQSSAPEDTESYTIEALAGDVATLLDHLEVDICALVGSSFGGMVALQFAVTLPERLAGLVLSDTSAAFDHPNYDDRYHRREASIAEFVETVERFGTAEAGKRTARSVEDPFLAQAVRDRYARMSRDGIVGCARVRRERPNLLPQLAERIAVPVLICIGEDDPVRSACDVMARELPEARYLTFKGTGHSIPTRQPGPFVREVLHFFADIEDGKPIAGRKAV